MSLMRTFFFVLGLRWPRLKSLPSDLARRFPLMLRQRVCLKSRAKKIPKGVGARTYHCLTPLRMSKGPRAAAVEPHCPFHVCVEGFDRALQFWWAANLWKDLEETVGSGQNSYSVRELDNPALHSLLLPCRLVRENQRQGC